MQSDWRKLRLLGITVSRAKRLGGETDFGGFLFVLVRSGALEVDLVVRAQEDVILLDLCHFTIINSDLVLIRFYGKFSYSIRVTVISFLSLRSQSAQC